ncbi:MAG: DUF4347 domain-containing protein, partial [Microcystis aeruginosa L111-01]|nr:DUF4347 domain-containing protein [Microcystis aeruginosa L111-01]
MSQSFPNILFIDTQLASYQQLLDAVLPSTEVILINSNQDGVEAITAALSNRTNLKSIQVISHGSQGQLQLGNIWLNSHTLQDYSAKIQSWGNALIETGDILFYGCNLAADEAGLSLIQNISQLTGADVAASEDLTGSALLGGDWDLEANTGAIESSLAISAEGQANYTETLAIPSLTVYESFLVEGYNSVNSDGHWNRITLSLSNYDQKSSFYISYNLLPDGLESQGSVSSNDYSDPNSGSFQITPSKVYSKNGQLLVDIPIIINNDSLWDQQEYMDFRLNPTSEYTVTGADQYNNFLQIVSDNHPQVSIGNYWEQPTKTEGEPLRVKEITRIELDLGKQGVPILSGFDLYFDVTGTAIRGSFANTQKGSDYKLFYTFYKRDPLDYGKYTQVDSRKAFPDPVANTSIYKINVPAGTTSIIFQAEDINDEVFEPTETIKITLVEDDVVLGLAERSSGDKYYVAGKYDQTQPISESDKKYLDSLRIKIVNLLENEPIVSLGKVVNPTEGFGYGSTIEGLEDAIALNGTQSVTIPAKSSLNLANTGKFTLEAWIFPNFTDNTQHDIISYQGGTKTGYPSISIINQISLQIGFGDGTKWNTKTIEKAINPKGWNHIASTFDGTDYKIYVNAVEIYSTTEFAGQKPAPTQQLEIGKDFIGAIDEVRIWDTARSAGELQSLMISELTGTEAGLVGYWDFNQNLTNKAIQDSSNPHKGTINGTVEYLNKPAPQIGYIEVNLDKPFQGPQGLWVKYDITSGTATQNSDYFNSRYRKVSTDANSERNGIIIPQGETSAKIYFAALNDAVVEGDETINIKLIPHNFDQENLVVNPNIYVVDLENRNVQVFDNLGNLLSTFGAYGTGDGQFNNPQDLVQDKNGNIYVVDSRGYNVQVFDSNGKFLRKFGSQGTGNGQFTDPWNIDLDSQGNIYVVDRSRKNIQVFNNSGTFLRQIGSSGTGDGQFSDPQTLAIDKNDNVYVADAGNDNVQVFDNTGKYLRKFNLLRSGIYNTNTVDMALDSSGNIYLLDSAYNNVQVFSNSGTFLRQFGSYGTGNGQFIQAVSIGIDGNGNIYVGDGRDDVQIFDSSGNYISKFGSSGSGKGQFNSPTGITFDNSWPNSNYGISATNNSATITIKDNQAYTQGVILFDATNQPISDKNPLAIKNGTADFKIKLTSQPTSNVTVSLSSNQGSLTSTTVTFTSSNWDTLQTVKLNGVSADGNISASAAGYFTGTKTFGFTINPPLKVTEGSTTDAVPVTPEVIISSLGDVQENGGESGNFIVNLSAPAPKGGININYTVAGTATQGTDYQNLTGKITIAEGDTTGQISILPIADDVTEPNETVTITLATGTGYKLTTDTSKKQATLNVLNDDTAGIKVVNAQKITDTNNNLVTSYSDNLVAVVTSEPYPNVNNVLQLWDNNNKLLGSVTLTQEQINAGKISLNVTGTLPNSQQLRAILKENSTVNQGLTLDNGKINLNGSTVEITLPSIGNQALVGIRLQSKPTADVTVSFKDIDNTETSLDKTSVTFTPQNWQEYQVVTVTGLDDLDLDGDISYNITAFVSATNDPNYSGKTFDLPVKNLDDDQKLDPSALNTPSKINYTLKFDGLDDHVAISNGKVSATSLKLPTSVLTVEAWVNIAQFKDWSSAISFLQDNGSTEAGFALGTMATGQFYLAVAGGGNGLTYLNSPSKYSTNQWYHIAGVYNGSKMELFINGESVATSTAETGNIYYLDSWYRLGMYKDDNEDVGLNGQIREVRVWNVARSGADIKANKNTSLSGQETGLINYYQGNLTTDNFLFDNGSNRQNGVLANGASVSVISLPTVSIGNPVTVAEGNTNAVINVNLSQAATQTIDVIFSIPQGTAVINQDYQISQTYLINQFEADGKARFASPFDNIDVGDNAKPTFADLDNDGDLDAIIGHQTGIKYFKNLGSPSSPLFAEQTGSQNPFGNINIQGAAPTFADLNGDLTLDLAVGTDTGTIIYYINNGDRLNPRFVLPSGLIPVQNDPFTGIDVGDQATPVLVDYDQDGDNDLIVGSQASGISYYRNTGNKNSPTFTKSTSNPFANISGNAPILVDYDSDTDLDIFIGQANGVVTYWENNNGTFAQNASKNPFAKITNTASLATNSAPAVVDLNGEGFKDAFIGVNNGKIDYYEQFNLVTFNAGETSKTINLQIKDDQIAEDNETLEITLYPNNGYNLGSPQNYLSLDGTDDYVAIPNAKLAGDYTIETWVYIDSKTQNFSSILELGNDTGSERIFWGLRNNQSQLFLETITNSQSVSYTLPEQLPQKQWVHLAVSFDNSGVGKFYVNGELKTTVSGFKLPTETVKTVNYLGKGRGGYQFAGKIKNLTIWDKSLTQTEIQA